MSTPLKTIVSAPLALQELGIKEVVPKSEVGLNPHVSLA
jgi:hypothetical protein